MVTHIGEPGDSFFVIIDGTVTVRTPVGAGSQLHPGDFFGEMSLLDGEPRSATIVAATDLRLLIVDRAHFWRLMDETPDLIRRILTILSILRIISTPSKHAATLETVLIRKMWPLL